MTYSTPYPKIWGVACILFWGHLPLERFFVLWEVPFVIKLVTLVFGLKNVGSENTCWSQTHVLKGNMAELMGQLSKAKTGKPHQINILVSTRHTQCPACLLRNKFCFVDFLEEKTRLYTHIYLLHVHNLSCHVAHSDASIVMNS